MVKAFNVHDYLRNDKLPHIWCPGCGNGIVTSAFIRAVDDLRLSKDKTVIVSGIGCSSRVSGYLDFNTIHTTHGRPLAFATGIKLAKPDLKVVVMAGDGDSTGIGGNHLLHAARRNIDITMIIYNNRTYGMTGGQASPLSLKGNIGTTAPYGALEETFDICELAKAAGATYVARSTTYHAVLLEDVIMKGLKHHGFSLIEAFTQCPVNYGKRNKMNSAVQMMDWYKNNTIRATQASKLPAESIKDKIKIGILHQIARPEYVDEYENLVKRLQGDING